MVVRQLTITDARWSMDSKILTKLLFLASLNMKMILSFYIVLFDPSSHRHELSQEKVNL